MNRKPNRLAPPVPTQNYQTFAVRSPLQTHFRSATCAEVGCADYENGWSLRLEGLPPELVHAAKTSGRKYREARIAEGETYLLFDAGQPCFRESTHVKSLDRPEFFFIGRGDHRSFSTRKALKVDSPDEFVDRFASHLDRLKAIRERG